MSEDFKAKGNQAYKTGNYSEAISCYSKAIDQNSSDPALYTNRAACYLQQKEYKKAAEDAQRAITVDPKFTRAYLRAGLALLSQGKISDAKRQLEAGLNTDPSNEDLRREMVKIERIDSLISKGQQQLAEQQFQDALSSFEMALALAPQAVQFKVLKAEAMLGLKQFSDVSKLTQDILQNDDTNCADAYYVRGKALFYDGSQDQGLRLISQALMLDPDNKKAAHFRRDMKKMERVKEEGNDAFKQGQWQRAYDKYTEAIAIDPLNAKLNSSLYYNRAGAAIKLSQLEQAEKDVDLAIELDEEYRKAYVRRAQIRQQLNKHELAMYDLQRAHDMDPSDRDVNAKLQEAKKLAKQAKKKDYYGILGVGKDADEEEIKKAYKKQCMKWHPDRYTDPKEKEEAEAKFKEIGEANDVLSDPQKKRRYDMGHDDLEGGMDFGDMGMDGMDILRMFMGGMGGGGMGGGMPFGGMGGMGGGGRGRRGGHGMGGMPGGFQFYM